MDERDGASREIVDGSLEQAEALRESLTSREREQVETTVAELLDLLGRTHTMVVLSEFAFADGSLRFSEIEGATDLPPNTLSTRLQELTVAGLLDRRQFDEVPPSRRVRGDGPSSSAASGVWPPSSVGAR